MIKRATIFNLLCYLEQNYNLSWRAYRQEFGRKDATHRWVEIKE